MKKILLFFILLILIPITAFAQSTIFTETMGTVSATTAILAHETANGFDNDSYTMSNGGVANSADIRATSFSNGYSGASGSANVWFTSTANSYGFSIEGINASSYTNLILQFAYRKESSTALPALALDYWDGTSWVNVPFTFAESANAAVAWYLGAQINLPVGAQINNLKIRWVKSGTVAVRIDDVVLKGTQGTPALDAPVATAATNIAQNSFTANWNSSTGATKYLLDVSTDINFATKLANYNAKDVGNTTTASVTGLNASTPYYYRVRASNGTTESANSNRIDLTTLASQTNTSVQFSLTSASVKENDGTYNLVFTIANPSATLATSFDVAITGGTGSAADVNNYTTQTVTFPIGSSANQQVTLTLTDDAIAEANETLIFSIQNVSGGTNASVGANSTFTLTISDPTANTPPVIANVTRNIALPLENESLIVSADITDDGTISSASLIYNIDGGLDQNVAMVKGSGNSYSATIPESAYGNGSILKYKITAVDNLLNSNSSNDVIVLTGITPTSVIRTVDVNGVARFLNLSARVSGVATVTNGVFSATNLEINIQDNSGGITVFKSAAASKAITLGNIYTVVGVITQYNGLTELVPADASTDIVNLGTGVLPDADTKTIAQLLAAPENFEGKLIKIVNVSKTSGTWASSQSLTVTDGTGTSTIRLSASTNIHTNPEPTWPQDVVGIFTQFDNATPFTDGYQLKPRAFADFGANSSPPEVPNATAASNVSSFAFTANWDDAAGADKFFIDVATSELFENGTFVNGYQNKDAGSTTSINVTGLSASTNYFYRLRSYNAYGTSNSSNVIEVSTIAPQATKVQFVSNAAMVKEGNGVYNLTFSITNPDLNAATTFNVAFIGASSTANLDDISNYSTQTVTFPAGSFTNQTVALTIANDNIAEPNETALFQIENVSGGFNAAVGTNASFTLTITDPEVGYYSGIDGSLKGNALRLAVHNLIKVMTKFNYDGAKEILKAADEDPKNSNNVMLIYSGNSVSKNSTTAWNREHVWSQSHGNFGTSTGPGTDAHHLRPEDPGVNSRKGNLDFDNGGTVVANGGGSKADSDSWEPVDSVKGDVARMILYMDVRYESDDTYDLVAVDYTPTTGGAPKYGKLSTLLAWHQQDPPSNWERRRNDIIYTYQKNKNPFIDNPEWVASIWGGNNPPVITNVNRNYLVPNEDQNLTVSADITDDGSISSASLIYNIDGGTDQTVLMTKGAGNSYSGVIPESAYTNGKLLKYKIKAVDNNSSETASNNYLLFTGITNISVLKTVDVNGVLTYPSIYAKVKGIATVSNNVFATATLDVNIQDLTAGINVVNGTSATITAGKRYIVSGALSQVNGLALLNVQNNVTDIVDDGASVEPLPLEKTMAQLIADAELYEGTLVKIKNVNKTSGSWSANSTLVITDATSSAVALKIVGSTNIASNTEPAWPVDVVGIFSQDDSSSPFTSGYLLKPRAITDFIQQGSQITKNVVLNKGWNIIAVPVTASNMATTTLFPNFDSQTYSFDGSYNPAVNLLTGKGYWIKYLSAQTVNVTGSPVASTTIPVVAGWNLIGAYDKDIAVSSITSTPANIIASMFYGYSNEYIIPVTLEVGKGYWIKVNSNGVLNIASVSKTNSLNAFSNSIDNSWGRIIIKDRNNLQKTLYVSNQSINSSYYELPPTPPAGILDARWNNNSIVEQINNGCKELLFSSTNYPLEITVDGLAVNIKDSFGGSHINKVIAKGDKLVITNKNINSLIVESVVVPTSFQLLQNYPNPFNPSTVISYQIPVAGHVTLKVFDILGREVATLVDEIQQPGVYTSTFSALRSSFSSSVYLYELRAGNFRAVKKLMLMK